jgi:hypothetical protein
VVERIGLDRHHEIVVAERTLVQPGPGRRLAAAALEHWTPSLSACDRDRFTRIG